MRKIVFRTLFIPLFFIVLGLHACHKGNQADPVSACTDLDGDGYGSPGSSGCRFVGLDCNDNDPDIHPGNREEDYWAPVCGDGTDNDCDGAADDQDNGCGLNTRAALEASESLLPLSVPSCSLIAERQCIDGRMHECAIYDPSIQGFPDPPPPFTERIFFQDRYMDLYQSTENSGLGYYTTGYQAPGTAESEWTAPENLDRYVDHGDGAFYMGLYLFAAAHRYAITGTEADYDRMVMLLEKQLNNWRVNGVPGYMIRATFAMLDPGISVPAGTPEYNLHGYKERTNHVVYTVSDDNLEHVPAYYHEGVEIDGTFYNTTPTMEGSPSLDAYSGAFLGFQFAWDLLRPADQNLKDEITECVTCFLKRMKKFRIRNLADSPFGRVLIEYLLSLGAFHPDPDDIDLGQVSTMTGYVQEAIPPGIAGDFEFGCPEELPLEVDPKYDFDAKGLLFPIQFAVLNSRLNGEGIFPIDFIYFVSHRGGDVGYLINYLLFAHHITGEQQYLDFLKTELIGQVNGLEVLNTAGSFYLPPYCHQWIGGDLIHPILYATLARVQDSLIAPAHRRALLEEFKNKLFVNDNNAYFGMTYGAVMDRDLDPDVDRYTTWAAEELHNYKLNPDYPLDPKRNYNTDFISTPLPGYEPEPPTQEEKDVCEEGIYLWGFEIFPPPGIDPEFEVISRSPLPVELRVPHPLIWHFSPFNLRRDRGNKEGRDHMTFIDLTLPFWIGRYHGMISSGHGTALGWKNLETPCEEK